MEGSSLGEKNPQYHSHGYHFEIKHTYFHVLSNAIYLGKEIF